MRITKVKLDNYVCFLKTPELELGPGVIIIVGANNSGENCSSSCTGRRWSSAFAGEVCPSQCT